FHWWALDRDENAGGPVRFLKTVTALRADPGCEMEVPTPWLEQSRPPRPDRRRDYRGWTAAINGPTTGSARGQTPPAPRALGSKRFFVSPTARGSAVVLDAAPHLSMG